MKEVQINIKKLTRDRLRNISQKWQNYDILVRMLLNNYKDKLTDIHKREYNSNGTIIVISDETKSELKELSRKFNVTYDDVINKLIDLYEEDKNEDKSR